jgi:ATP-dependent protease ClpP protease subunit
MMVNLGGAATRRFGVVALCLIFLFSGFGIGYGVEEMMEIPYTQGTLSVLSFVCGGKGHIKFFSHLSVADVTNLWNDLIVFKDMGITEVSIYLNSPGGDAFAGLAAADQIYRAVNKNGFTITAHATGIVASAAVPIFAVCSHRTATTGTIFMVHEAALWKWPGRETASDIRSQNQLMEMLQNRYLTILAANSELSFEDWKRKESETTWFTAEDAFKWGLVDEIE